MDKYHCMHTGSFFDLVKQDSLLITTHYWLIEVQCGIIDSSWVLKNPQNEDLYFGSQYQTTSTSDMSIKVFNPGALTIFGKYIQVDEDSTYFGFKPDASTSIDSVIDTIMNGQWNDIFMDILATEGIDGILLNHIRNGEWFFASNRKEQIRCNYIENPMDHSTQLW